jgi:hypothetical protein
MHKARFSEHFRAGYEGAFDPHDNHRLPIGPGKPGDHGAAGSIVSVAVPDIVVADVSGTEKTIAIGADTIIREGTVQRTSADLANGMRVVVFGEPDKDAVIAAKFIRIFADTELPDSQQGPMR